MEIKPSFETLAKIKVVGIGGGGCSAVSRMHESRIKGIEFIAVNTDAQALHTTSANKRIHIGKSLTKGLGAGMNPELGRQAAEEDQEDIKTVLKGADMIFLTCGLGGGTGTGGIPVVAAIARELGVLTVAVVTKPFTFEGTQRAAVAEKGLENLRDKVDTLITIPNDKILQIIDKKTTLIEAFRIVDEVLKQGIQGISDLIILPGIVNVDFADVKAIMKDAGSALMGIGQASGDNRAQEAAKLAIASPLLELSINGARGVLFNVTAGENLGMKEVEEAAKVITEPIDSNAKVIFGAVRDDRLKDNLKITVIATGFEGIHKEKEDKEEKGETLLKDAEVERGEEAEKKGESDELDIPAFIRRKIKK